MFKRDTPEYITLHTISCYSIIFEPYQSSQTYMLRKKKRRMADTHLSIETTYITYPICYTMMLPNMPFRKADAHPLRLNTRCKDLTLVPSKKWNLSKALEPPWLRLQSCWCWGTTTLEVVYALGRTKGCSKYSKAENNKTPPLYKYVEGLQDTHMTNCVNRLRNHDGLKIAEAT